MWIIFEINLLWKLYSWSMILILIKRVVHLNNRFRDDCFNFMLFLCSFNFDFYIFLTCRYYYIKITEPNDLKFLYNMQNKCSFRSYLEQSYIFILSIFLTWLKIEKKNLFLILSLWVITLPNLALLPLICYRQKLYSCILKNFFIFLFQSNGKSYRHYRQLI